MEVKMNRSQCAAHEESWSIQANEFHMPTRTWRTITDEQIHEAAYIVGKYIKPRSTLSPNYDHTAYGMKHWFSPLLPFYVSEADFTLVMKEIGCNAYRTNVGDHIVFNWRWRTARSTWRELEKAISDKKRAQSHAGLSK